MNNDRQLSLIDEIEKTSYTNEQKSFIEYDGKDSVFLISTAGSGKTFSCVHRLKYLINKGVDPKKIIFFSFTKAATEELKRRVGNNDVKITTIHAFALGILAKAGKFKKIITFYDFLKWYKDKYKPDTKATLQEKQMFYEMVSEMYDDADYHSSQISSYKLQIADGISTSVPKFLKEYNEFLKNEKARDFSDMLIEVRGMLKEEKWLSMFKNKYDYIFIDEYQDTSVIQLQILLSLNAKYYYLIGDRNQSIYGYSGANCDRIEEMLKARRKVVEKTLSVNFRSDKSIIQNSNRFSQLKAVGKSDKNGFVKRYLIFEIDGGSGSLSLIDVLNSHSEVAVLSRTNATIKKLEFELLKRKYPMKYFNYLSDNDFELWKKKEVHIGLKNRLDKLKPFFNNNENEIFTFIQTNKNSNKLITSIHKSKGREFDYCVVVNSLDKQLLEDVGIYKSLSSKQLERISFDEFEKFEVEPKNIHYVAVSRSRHGLYYMLYGI